MRENNFRKTSVMLGFLLTIILFVQCKDDSSELFPNFSDETKASNNGSSTSAITDQGVLNIADVRLESGYAYHTVANLMITGDSQSSPTSSTLKIYENGRELGPAHSSHKDVRSVGKGRFSHWGNELYFSASDNSNPISNGRKYTYTIGDVSGIISPAAPGSSEHLSLKVASAQKESGNSYYLDGNFGITGDSQSSPTSSTLKIYENGKELGPAHSSHKEIRSIGNGRFSHWENELYFSSSDNSDPRTNGRRYTYTVGVGVADNPLLSTNPTAPIGTDVPVGFAMVNGSTTGGKGGKTVTVTSLNELKKAASSKEPMIIQVSGIYTGTGMINVSSNKTIIGLKGATLNGVGLAVYEASNVIIKNMKINKVVGGDCITIKFASHHIWVDHCELWQDRNHGWEYYDELLEVTDRSDYVTISNTKFHDTHIALLIGSGDQQTTDIGHLRVTLYGNYFYNVSERQPSTRFGYMHVFNNYFLDGSGYAIGSTMNATVRTDNNYFENQKVPITTVYNSKPGVISGANTNFYKNSGDNKISTAASTWIPGYEYKSKLIAAADVASRVASEAGPKY